MRSTGGAVAPSGRTFSGCELPATPSLCAVMDLPVGIVLDVPPGAPLGAEPRVEARGQEAVGAFLALGGGGREDVDVFVLGVAGVATDPPPGHRVGTRRLLQLLPQLEILDRAAFAFPPARLPSGQPL